MKLKKLFIGMAAIMIALTGCAQKQSETAGEKPAEETKGKVLVPGIALRSFILMVQPTGSR